jgi:hypothetical protein
MTCPHLVDSGVYVLGALAPAQRLEFEQHMTTCAECRAEVSELAVLPGLLGRLDEPSVVGSAELPIPSVLPNVLAKVHRQQRGRRVLAGAAAIVVAALALVAGLNLPASGPAAPKPGSVGALTSSAPVVVNPIALHDMMPEDPDATITAQVGFTPVVGGTQIELKCQYPKTSGTTYSGKKWFGLFAVPVNGKPAQELGTWGVNPGDNGGVPATVTSWSVPQMSRLELRDSTGAVVLFYNF